MRALILVPDGVGVRNFVLGRFLRVLTRSAEATVLHAIPEALVPTYAARFDSAVDWEPLIPYRETPLTATLRYSLSYAQMQWVNTRSMRFNASFQVKGSWKTRAVHQTSRLVGRVAKTPARMQRLDTWHCAAVSAQPSVEHYRRLFRAKRPDVLFCSHQRPPVVLPAVLAAREAGIPTATFIFSWDNLTSKGRIAAPFEHYLVWSELMRTELLQYYPSVSPDKVHVVGTPQFDPYTDPSLLWSREDFCRGIGADPARPLICYSGGDTGNCPEDQAHVRILMSLIREGAIKGNPQVLLRPSPVDDGVRYESVRRDFPELIYAPPAWIHTDPGNWAQVFPDPSDVQFLANVTHHADLNVNFGSTMTLDFSAHDKPVINPTFDVRTPPVFGMSLYEFCTQFEHYKPVESLGAARFAKSADDLAAFVNAYLADPALDRDGRRKLVEMQIGQTITGSIERIVEVLHTIAADAPARSRRTVAHEATFVAAEPV
jgi:hypothetical protein